MQQTKTLQNVRYNFTVNVFDGTFFGLGLGFSSFAAILPLFFSTLTDNTALLGFVSALHMIGWALPQMFTSKYVSRLRRYKPFVLLMTMQERWPFFGLALVAWFSPQMDKGLALALGMFFLLWHSFGGGFTATAWQSMIGKIMPSNLRGTFWGVQGAAASLMVSGGALVAGTILERVQVPYAFALCFLLTALTMTFSFVFLASTREKESQPVVGGEQQTISWRKFAEILKQDRNFGWFLVARSLSQVAPMAAGFYVIYATRHLGMDAQTAGAMVAVNALAQMAGNLLLGWVGDNWGHRKVFALGGVLLASSALVAIFAPEQSWFYLAFALSGVANATLWATAMAMTIEFGKESERPMYIGVTNTLTSVPLIAAPIIGGWLADAFSFQATFLVSVVSGVLMTLMLLFVVRDPQRAAETTVEPALELNEPVAVEVVA